MSTIESIMNRSGGFLIRVATTEADKLAFQELVYRVYCKELRWLPESRYPEGRVTDEYDQKSVITLVEDGKGIAGCMRFVPGTHFSVFPHEKSLGTKLPILPDGVSKSLKKKLGGIPRNRFAEITRTMSFRKGSSVLGGEFAKAIYWFSRYNGISALFTVIDMSGFLLSTKVGMPIVPVGIPSFCEGSWSVPGIIIAEDIEKSIKTKAPGLWEHVTDESSVSGFESNKELLIA